MDDVLKYKLNSDVSEIVVKYTGNLAEAVAALGGSTEILSEDFAIVTIPTSQIDALYHLSETEYLEIPKRLYFMRFSSQKSACIYEDMTFGGGSIELDGSGTLIGIIDSGIDIYNRDFINDDGTTRIFGILDLSSGKRYTREEINISLESGERLDFSDPIGHGTAIAGICAGNGRSSGYTGIAPACELLIVKLGINEGYARSTDIMRGLKYIKDMAESVSKPVAVNISYGTNDGSHDGSSLLEEFINEVADDTVCSICIASGNEGASGHHYRGDFNDNEPVRFNIGRNIKTMYMSIWKSFTDDAGIILTSPSGTKSGVISESTRLSFGSTIVNVLFSLPSPYSLDAEIYINFQSDTEVESGIWVLELVPQNIVYGSFDIWLPVTEAVGNETFFLRADPYISLTLPSAANKALTVGGYNQLTETVLDFSGRGYTRFTNYIKPDITAPAYRIPAPMPGGGTDVFTGTSFATPHATGSAALIMQWGIVLGNDLFMYGERLKAFIIKGARRYALVDYPNEVLGWGRLCFENTMRLIEQEIPVVSAQQTEGITTAQAAYSDDYLDFVRRRSSIIFDAGESEDILSCTIDENFSVMYIRKTYYTLNKNMLENTLGIRTPFLMGLMQYETALEKSGITMVQNQPYLNLRGSGVLVAIIDTGIDYKNESFIYEDGTSKIQYIWDQSEGEGNESLCFGIEYTNEDINRALAGDVEINTTDEIGHGTVLAEIAAGRNGAAPDAELIVVKLKQAKKSLREEMFIDDSVPAFESSDLMLGVSYAYRKADELNRPLVICIGIGTNQGGHSGQTALEQYLSSVADRYGVCLCTAAGNEGIARHHASVEFNSSDNYKDVELTVAEGEPGINVWIWNFIVNSVAIEIISPLGETIARLRPVANFSNSYTLSRGGGVVNVSFYMFEDIASDQFTSIRITKPAMGIWVLRLYNNNATSGTVHLWLPMTGFIKDNTFFLNSNPSVTVVNPASGDSVMTVGGYNTADNSIYAPSGRGPTRLLISKPHFCAPAVNLNGHSGTSLACAITAGASALMMEWLILRNGIYTANTGIVLTYLIMGAQGEPGEVYPNNIWGYGRLNLYASFINL